MSLINENVKEYMEYRNWVGIFGYIKLIVNQLKRHLLLRLGQNLPHSILRVSCFRSMGVNIRYNVFIGLNVLIDPLYPELVTINDFAEIGDNAHIYAHSRGSRLLKQIYPRVLKRVVVGRGAWIGAPNVVIMPGVNIGDYSVVAAGAVVTKNVPKYCVVAGVPAKVIKELDRNMIIDI